jgi:hypothetical protein
MNCQNYGHTRHYWTASLAAYALANNTALNLVPKTEIFRPNVHYVEGTIPQITEAVKSSKTYKLGELSRISKLIYQIQSTNTK